MKQTNKPGLRRTLRRLAHNEDGVSAVIGVILMIAVTVLLGSVVYIFANQQSKVSDKTPSMQFRTLASDADTGMKLGIVSVSEAGYKWDEFTLIVYKDDAAPTEIALKADLASVTAGDYTLTGEDAKPDGASVGDLLLIKHSGTASLDPASYRLVLVHEKTQQISSESKVVVTESA